MPIMCIMPIMQMLGVKLPLVIDQYLPLNGNNTAYKSEKLINF